MELGHGQWRSRLGPPSIDTMVGKSPHYPPPHRRQPFTFRAIFQEFRVRARVRSSSQLSRQSELGLGSRDTTTGNVIRFLAGPARSPTLSPQYISHLAFLEFSHAFRVRVTILSQRFTQAVGFLGLAFNYCTAVTWPTIRL